MTHRTILSAVAMLALAGLGAAYFAQSTPASQRAVSAESAMDADSLKALHAEVAELRRQTQNNTRHMLDFRTMAAQAATPELPANSDDRTEPSQAQVDQDPTAPPVRPGPDSEEYRAWQAERQVMIADTEASFQDEVRNSDWSRKASADLEDAALKHGSAKQVLRAIDCRSTTCRVEVIDDPEKAEDIRDFLMDASTIFPTMVADRVEVPGAPSSYVMYFKSGA